jgi:catechol-2,3-dioxygenase
MQIKELGHVVLYVTNLERSASFYRDVLGFREIGRQKFAEGGVAMFSGGRTHHELLLIEIGGKPRQKKGPEPGLYHVGFKIGDSDEDLRRAYREIKERGVTIVGASDHHVSHGLYIFDPDGNEIELYVDVSDEWKRKPELILKPGRPLDLE